MKDSLPDLSAPRRPASGWFWACTGLVTLLFLLLLLSLWAPLPALAPPSIQQEPKEARLFRLAEQLAGPADAWTLPFAGPVSEEPAYLEVELDADRFRRMELAGHGSARRLVLAWTSQRADGSRRREMAIPLEPAEGIRTRVVPVADRPSWRGRITRLELRAEGGTFLVDRLTVRLAPGEDPSLTSDGVTTPGWLATESYDLSLPALPDAVFEGGFSLLPGAGPRGAELTFRAVLETPNGEQVWTETTIAAPSGEDAAVWQPLKREVSIPPGSRLRLSAQGEPALASRAYWGNPLLVRQGGTPGRDVVVVVIDTLRADVLGSYGSPLGLTPNLDRLAEESLRLADLRAPAPWTLPSVATLMTGLGPAVHRAGEPQRKSVPRGLAEGFETLAEALAAEGFYTAGIYNNVFLAPSFGLGQGFDRYEYAEVSDRGLVDRALEVLKSTRDRRLFLFLHLFGPHNPYEPPEEACHRLTAGLEDPGVACSGDRFPRRAPARERRWLEALYRAEVMETDAQLGRLLEALKTSRPAGEPLLLVVSDHGEDFWARQDQLARAGYEPDADHGHHFFQELLQVPG
ncbi:MAG: sulfatase, partial [Acidobacteria bacterium]|nr:sulfatase [Acidobacteriota bacterium]